MNVTVKGFLLTTAAGNVLVSQKPSNTVVRYISQAEYKTYTSNMMSKYVVAECLPAMDGTKVMVYYIKK